MSLPFALRSQGGKGRQAVSEGLSSLSLHYHLYSENSKSLSSRHFSGRKELAPALFSFRGRIPDTLDQCPAPVQPPGMPAIPRHWFRLFPTPSPFPVGGHMYSITCPKGFLLPSSAYHILSCLPEELIVSVKVPLRNRWLSRMMAIWYEFNKGLFIKLVAESRETIRHSPLL